MKQLAIVAHRWWGEIPLYIYALLCAAGVFYLWSRFDIPFERAGSATSFQLIYTVAIGWFFVDIVYRLFRDRPDRPIAWAKSRYFSSQSLAAAIACVPVLAICAILIPVFSSLKAMIPLFTPFDWDTTFIAWERTLLLGFDAWEVMQPFLGYPVVTAALALFYHLWVLLLYLGVTVVALSGSVGNDLRRRFFLSYALAWSLVGGLLATLLASVGPVFAEPILGIPDFAPQMDYLRWANEQVPVMTVRVQDMLLESYLTQDNGLGRGISAMPSMHVAICVLFWLTAREVSKVAGRIFFWFMVLIWIGSVHLAYHYALDGLLSLIAMLAIWKAVPFIFAAWDSVPIPGNQAALRTNTVPAE